MLRGPGRYTTSLGPHSEVMGEKERKGERGERETEREEGNEGGREVCGKQAGRESERWGKREKENASIVLLLLKSMVGCLLFHRFTLY